jgi:NADH:ubiquinone oxidoreductase subunit D
MTYRIQKEARKESMLLNMGPSHPAMHGTTRIMLELSGEKILNAELEMGYLHRGFEKICEHKTYFNLLPYTDRMNYVSPLINNCGYVMTLEKMMGIEVPERAQYILSIKIRFLLTAPEMWQLFLQRWPSTTGGQDPACAQPAFLTMSGKPIPI